jgi:hypothetical protein
MGATYGTRTTGVPGTGVSRRQFDVSSAELNNPYFVEFGCSVRWKPLVYL